jgi:hypothetical protein
MLTDPLTDSLRNHANLQNGDDSRSILHALWLRGRGASHSDLGVLSDNVLDLLSELNTRWNTSNPEAVAGKVVTLDRQIVGSLAEILARGFAFSRSHPDDLEAYKTFHRIETAWRAVLAGDIADLRRHIHEMEAMS